MTRCVGPCRGADVWGRAIDVSPQASCLKLELAPSQTLRLDLPTKGGFTVRRISGFTAFTEQTFFKSGARGKLKPMLFIANRMRIVGAAIVLIALLLVPSVAQAHAGHRHIARPAISSGQTADSVAAAVDHRAAKPVQAEVTQISKPPAGAPQSVPCTGGCCSGAPCTACVGMAPVDLPTLTPPMAASSIVLPHVSESGGLAPDGLRRPPKSFA